MMSEPETKLEIEDVLSSIRRLVSRDAGVMRSMPSAPRATASALAPIPTPPPVDADCLVLTPALRIEQAEAEAAQVIAPALAAAAPVSADDAAAVVEAELLAAGLLDLAAPDLPEPDLPEPDLAEPALPDLEGPAQDFSAADEIVPEAEAAIEAGAGTAPLLLSDADLMPAPQPVEQAAPLLLHAAEPVDVPASEPPAAPRPMTEAEALLAEAEAALMETGMVLDDATSAIDAAGDTDVLNDDLGAGPVVATSDLGDELSRLESTIAELEAAVAESGFEFEPETGHPFEVDAAEALPATFETEMRDAIEAPLTETLSAPEDEAPDDAASEDEALDCALPECSAAERAGTSTDAEAIDTGFPSAEAETVPEEAPAAVISAVTADAGLPVPPAAEESGLGMDWAEATLNLARRAAPRRLAASEAEETLQSASTMRSSYEELREELAQGSGDPAGAYSETLVPSYEDGLIDEAVLRDMVAQLVREELRGSLGERITQNVRRLVRREIQRALMGPDLD